MFDQTPEGGTMVAEGLDDHADPLALAGALRCAGRRGGQAVDERSDMGALDGRVAIITGAGRGLGREHALLFAAEGAKVVVNDLGGDSHGEGADATPAQQTVADIMAAGGEAVVNGDNVADWDGARAARAARRSTRSATSTCSSTTPASCATG